MEIKDLPHCFKLSDYGSMFSCEAMSAIYVIMDGRYVIYLWLLISLIFYLNIEFQMANKI